ncbi:MAG: histidine phosphatase family protein [Lachnospiraceae bacterium]|nr:histidine phosphatase family protein [Lachnospiraceae bacterium]
MSILLVRHGETDWNVAKRVQGTTNIPLNKNGIEQAKLLCENLEKENANICRIYSSYQVRALSTAQIVGSKYHVPVKVIPGLEEMNLGLFEGHTWDEIEALYPDEFKRWQSDKRYNKVPKGESYQDLLERLFSAFDQIIQEANDDIDSGKDILILTHGAVIMSLLTLKNNLDFKTSYAVLNIENAKAIKLEQNDLQQIQQKLYRKQTG